MLLHLLLLSFGLDHTIMFYAFILYADAV